MYQLVDVTLSSYTARGGVAIGDILILCFYQLFIPFLQVMLMGGTIIGPGTIFLMLVGAFVAAFKISNWLSFYYNLIPIITYVFVCLVPML